MQKNSVTEKSRFHELDGLRVSVFGLLILYHIGMLYVADWGFHYKSAYSSEFLANIMLWSNQWRMSLLFFISGAALSFLLRKYPGTVFLRNRVPLLLLPWIFGMLVVVVPQVYVEANSKNLITVTNYWHFWYLYLDQTSVEFAPHKKLGSTHLTWNHLWFLPYLLAYSLILWCLNPVFNRPAAQTFFSSIAKKISLPLAVIIPVLGFYLIGALLYKDHPVTHNFVDDWFNQARSFFAFLLGFALIKLEHLWPKFKNIRWLLLVIASFTYSYCLFDFHGGSLGDSVLAKEISGLIWSANLWLWLLTIIAWGQVVFTATNPILQYVNRGVFCFYVLHQTLIIVFAYWLAPYQLGPWFEPLSIIFLTIIGCWLGYELIRRVPYVRVLFGCR
jgi:glucans biosynthesis protein C